MATPNKPNPETIRTVLSDCVPGLAPETLNALWCAVLNEMLLLYFPPFRARTEGELSDQVLVGLQAYIEDLAEFDGKTLRAAWKEVRRNHRFERWPTIESIRSECFRLSLKKNASSGSGNRQLSGPLHRLASRHREAVQRAIEERSRHEKMPFWQSAQEEKWAHHLDIEVRRRLDLLVQLYDYDRVSTLRFDLALHELDCIRSGRAPQLVMALDHPLSFPDNWEFLLAERFRGRGFASSPPPQRARAGIRRLGDAVSALTCAAERKETR